MAHDNHDYDSRRDFLKAGAALAAGSVLAGAAIVSSVTFEKHKADADKKTISNKIKVLTEDGHIAEVDANGLEAIPVSHESLDEMQRRGREGLAGKKWAMVIDLSKCRNARMCMASCQNAHELRPDQHHINVLRMKDAEHTEAYFMPKPCYHCDNPPCTKVCPVNATFKRQDGIVLIDNHRCIGCRFCIAGCPYSARVFNWEEPYTYDRVKKDFLTADERALEGGALDEVVARRQEELGARTYDVELNVPQMKGTISKCLFSADRLREGKLPYCVSACPNGVYWFGDLNEDTVTNGTTKETTRFSKLLRENAGYTVGEEMGTKPQVYYLPAKNRLFPFEYDGKTDVEHRHYDHGHHQS